METVIFSGRIYVSGPGLRYYTGRREIMTTYQEAYHILRSAFEQEQNEVSVLGIRIIRREFRSPGVEVLPEPERYEMAATAGSGIEAMAHTRLGEGDLDIGENKDFPYYIIQPEGVDVSGRAILLFHGLNEKRWDKYLPWAWKLARDRKRPVILFPIAFHMDRAPLAWSDAKTMHRVALQRAGTNYRHACTSFVNVAISIRLQHNPQRIFWSGLQTYIDIKELMRQIRAGQVTGLHPGARVDLFGYSIGAFFSLILMMANPEGFFSESRFFAFCGGATLDRMYPISRYILDTRSGLNLASYFSEQVACHFSGAGRLCDYLDNEHDEHYFRTMVHYNYCKEERESRLRAMSQRILAVPLLADTVVPPGEVLNTLCGDFRTIPCRVEPLDFDFPYDHVHPFSLKPAYAERSNGAFCNVMNRASAFFA